MRNPPATQGRGCTAPHRATTQKQHLVQLLLDIKRRGGVARRLLRAAEPLRTEGLSAKRGPLYDERGRPLPQRVIFGFENSSWCGAASSRDVLLAHQSAWRRRRSWLAGGRACWSWCWSRRWRWRWGSGGAGDQGRTGRQGRLASVHRVSGLGVEGCRAGLTLAGGALAHVQAGRPRC